MTENAPTQPSGTPEDDEGSMPAQATPPIGDDAESGQTQVPAPDDETGIPPDEEMNRESE
jgi:hypothetical protein